MKVDELIKRLSLAALDPPRPRMRGDHDIGPDRTEMTDLRRPAAVLVPVVDRHPEPTVILTQRTDHLPHHAGQVAFPGGRLEPEDAGAVDAALRETEEEIGLSRRHVEVIASLEEYVTGTGFSVTPVVGIVRPPFILSPDPAEVADVFEVPLAFILDPANHEVRSGVFRGRERTYYVLPFENRYIWGATAGMLVNLYERLRI